MAVNKTLHKAHHAEDPKKALLKKLGDISRKKFSGQQVVVATYVRPREIKKGGLVRTDDSLAEDIYQGKVGLIVAMGPQAREYLDVSFGEKDAPQINDWIFYRIHDGFMLNINGHECRILEAKAVRGTTDGPDDIL